MTLGRQIENTAVSSVSILPTVTSGIAIGILVSIIPVFLMSMGLKLTDRIVERVVN